MQRLIFINPKSIFLATVLYCLIVTVFLLMNIFLYLREFPLLNSEPLEKEMTIHSSILSWEIPWTEEFGGPHHGVTRARQDLVTKPTPAPIKKKEAVGREGTGGSI